MNEIAIIYWSGTGNTQAMAETIQESITSAGGSAKLLTPDQVQNISDYKSVALGCPSMGSEVLEETEFQPMWDEIKALLSGKKALLFGSYGWGDGEWMTNWEEDANSCGINVIGTVICDGAPDSDADTSLKNLAKELV